MDFDQKNLLKLPDQLLGRSLWQLVLVLSCPFLFLKTNFLKIFVSVASSFFCMQIPWFQWEGLNLQNLQWYMAQACSQMAPHRSMWMEWTADIQCNLKSHRRKGNKWKCQKILTVTYTPFSWLILAWNCISYPLWQLGILVHLGELCRLWSCLWPWHQCRVDHQQTQCNLLVTKH